MNTKSLLLAILLATSIFTAACKTDDIGRGGKITVDQTAKNGNYDDNLNLTADQFISKCCKSKIRREFPSEYYGKTLREIAKDKSKDGKKANKLLRQERFRK